MAAIREGRSSQVLLILGLLLFLNTFNKALAVPDYNEDGVPDMILREFDEDDSESLELGRAIVRNNNGTDCDWSQFGSDHTVNLTPLDECEKFRFNAGEIYQRGLSEEDKVAVIKIHNELRSKVAGGSETKGNPGPQPSGTNIMEVVWNDQLAVAAQAWANQCAVKHDKWTNRKTCDHKVTGQNVAHKRGAGNKPTTVHWTKFATSLYKEVKNMPNYAVDKMQKPPKGNSGHYTQVIWAKTYQVGCGVVYYYLYEERSNGNIRKHRARSFVCNYWPAGNYRGAQVYESGTPASNCENGVSTNYPNLCAQPSE